MDPAYSSIPLRHIDWEDSTYAIRSFQPFTELEASLERLGILASPWLLRQGTERFVVVDGFKRLQWAGEKGLPDVLCRVYPEGTDTRELWLRRLEGKLFAPPLNVAEKAQIISKLLDFLPEQTVVREFFPRLGVASRVELLERWRRLAAAGDDMLEAVASQEIFDRTALELMGWEDEAGLEMLSLFRELKCSASVQMEILDRLTEVALRQERARGDLLHDAELLSLVVDSTLNHRRKTGLLRERLTRMRFPRLQAREERFNAQWESLSLPGSLRLVHPPAFEGERWQLQITFSRPRDLLDLLGDAGKLAQSPALKSIMAPPGDSGLTGSSRRSVTIEGFSKDS